MARSPFEQHQLEDRRRETRKYGVGVGLRVSRPERRQLKEANGATTDVANQREPGDMMSRDRALIFRVGHVQR
jgi:hypothetical protein